MRYALACTLVLIAISGCTTRQRSPDAIREDTARATAEAKRDAKAVAQGLVDGLKQKGPVNINKASTDDLATLPGVDGTVARRIVDGRPYDDSYQLVKKHVISKGEFDRIADKIVAH